MDRSVATDAMHRRITFISHFGGLEMEGIVSNVIFKVKGPNCEIINEFEVYTEDGTFHTLDEDHVLDFGDRVTNKCPLKEKARNAADAIIDQLRRL